MRWIGFLLATLLAATGCNKTCDELAEIEPVLEIGTGRQSFTDIEETTGFEKGPQNGFHMYGSVRARGLFGGDPLEIDDKTPTLTYTLNAVDGDLAGGFSGLQRQMVTLPDGTIERVGDLVILETFEASDAEGVEIELFAEINDSCGRSASAKASTTLSEGAF